MSATAPVANEATYYEMFNAPLARIVPERARRILDVGCGSGVLGAFLKAQRPGREVWGLEYVPEAAKRAEERLDRVVVGDVSDPVVVGKLEGTFDCVVFGDVLEHLVQPAAVLASLRPCLAPDGEVVVCVPNVGHWSVVADLLAGRFTYTDAGLLDRTHLRFFTPESFRQLLGSAGFEVLEETANRTDNGPVVDVLCTAAAALGLDAEAARDVASTYQRLYRARARAVSTTSFVAAPDWEDAPALRDALAAYLGAFAPDDPVSLVLGVDADGPLGLEAATDVVVGLLVDLGHDPAAVADLVVGPFRGDPAAVAPAGAVWVPVGRGLPRPGVHSLPAGAGASAFRRAAGLAR